MNNGERAAIRKERFRFNHCLYRKLRVYRRCLRAFQCNDCTACVMQSAFCRVSLSGERTFSKFYFSLKLISLTHK